MEINAKNGNIKRVRKTVSSKAFMLKTGMINGQRSMPKATAMLTKNVRNVNTQEINSFVFSLLFSRRYSLRVGIKATAMELSAKSRRKRLGIIKATENASERAVVPSRAALVISRSSPNMRETNVRMDSAVPERSREGLAFVVSIMIESIVYYFYN